MDNVTLIERLVRNPGGSAQRLNHIFEWRHERLLQPYYFQEVESLCGKAYQRVSDSDYQRADCCFFGTDEESVRRPRERKDGKDVRLRPMKRPRAARLSTMPCSGPS